MIRAATFSSFLLLRPRSRPLPMDPKTQQQERAQIGALRRARAKGFKMRKHPFASRKEKGLLYKGSPRRSSPAIAALLFAAGAIAATVSEPASALDPQGSQIRIRAGFACDRPSGEFLYLEVHEEKWEQEGLVEDRVGYRSPAGREFAFKRVDYRASPLAPDFALEDRKTGHRESARRVPQSGDLEVTYRAPQDTPENAPQKNPPKKTENALVQSALVAKQGAPIIDAGFDRLVVQSWDRLLAGETISRPFLIPSLLGFVDMRLRLLPHQSDHQSDAMPEEKGEGSTAPIPSSSSLVAFELAIDSFWARLFVPAIRVYYESTSRELVRYEGPSNLRDAKGDNFDVTIDFTPRMARDAKTGESATEPDFELRSRSECASGRTFSFDGYPR